MELFTVVELKRIAKENKIPGYSKMKKIDLIKELQLLNVTAPIGCEQKTRAAIIAQAKKLGILIGKKSKSQLCTEIKQCLNKSSEIKCLFDRIRILSWNIDGLDSHDIITRTEGVLNIIVHENPDVVFLQEVTETSFELLKKCEKYSTISSVHPSIKKPFPEGYYFTAMMFNKTTTSLHSGEVIPFIHSVMMRTLLSVKATVNGIVCRIMTTHLESTRFHAKERMRQLIFVLEHIQTISNDETVIFGGDLNISDREISTVKIKDLLNGIVDAWEVTNCNPLTKYTWNTMLNDNLKLITKFRPKCRFDRLLYRTNNKVRAVCFKLVGLERLNNRRFPSDHWGILVDFQKMNT